MLSLERLREIAAEADDPEFAAKIQAERVAQGLPATIECDEFYDLVAAGLEQAERTKRPAA